MATKVQRSISSKITLIIIFSVVFATSIIGSVFYYKGRAMFIDNAALSTQNRLIESTIGLNNYYKSLKVELEFLAYIHENTTTDIENIYSKLHKFYYDQFYIAKVDASLKSSKFLTKNKVLKEGIINFSSKQNNNLLITDIHKYDAKFAYQWAIYKSNDYYYIIKINFVHLLNVFVRTIKNFDYIMVLNDKAQYLYSPYAKKNFAFEDNIDSTFYRDFYGVKKHFDAQRSFQFEGKLFNENYLFNFNLVRIKYLNQKLYIGIGLNLDKHLHKYNLVRIETFLYTVLLLAGTIFIGAFFSKFITRGLNTITQAAQDYAAGKKNIELKNIVGTDEIGVLAITFQGMMHQINERSRLQNKQEKELRMTRDEAENALKEKSLLLENLNKQKNILEDLTKEKDDLMAIVSHDLKNPLSVIDASMDLIREDSHSSISKTSTDLIVRSKNSAQISLRLITDLLDLARYEGGIKLDYSKFNLYEMITSSLDIFNLKLTDKNIKLNIDIPYNFHIQADFSRLSQVINNVVSNAIKFTAQNGKINVKALNDGTELKLFVSDNGAGIPENKIDSIFEKFSQARKSDRDIGTGLGLAICQKICELHKGQISVVSKTGVGTEFMVQIPGLSLIEAERKMDLYAPDNLKTILLAEDDDDIRMMISEVLEEYDLKILKARSSKEAQYLVAKNKIDFIITDYRLTDEDGLNLIKKIREHVDVPAIIMSGNVNTIPDDILKENKIIKFLVKPFKLNILADLLNDQFHFKSNTKLEKFKILFVDDSDDIRNLVKVLLKNESNIEVFFADDGKVAFDLVKKELFDFVFMDDKMPIMSGVEAMINIKALEGYEKSHCCYVAMSANSSPEDVKRYNDAGFDLSLGKPVTKPKILEIIKTRSGRRV